MSDIKALVLIPARYASTRFPGKPISKINNRPMVQWVYDGCKELENIYPGSVVAIVTDDERIESAVKGFGGKVVRIDDDVPSGSERIFLAYEREFRNQNFNYILNVQGDEPLINHHLLEDLLKFHHVSGHDVATVVKPIPIEDEGYTDSNKVKAIISQETGQCHYFTRASVPYNRDSLSGVFWNLHIGIYSFKPAALAKMCELNPSKNEKIECLEQLRLLDNGSTIGAVKTDMTLCGVDVPEDIRKVEGALGGK